MHACRGTKMMPYLLNETFLAKHLNCHANAVSAYHSSLLCSHRQISVRMDGQSKYVNPTAHVPRVNQTIESTRVSLHVPHSCIQCKISVN